MVQQTAGSSEPRNLVQQIQKTPARPQSAIGNQKSPCHQVQKMYHTFRVTALRYELHGRDEARPSHRISSTCGQNGRILGCGASLAAGTLKLYFRDRPAETIFHLELAVQRMAKAVHDLQAQMAIRDLKSGRQLISAVRNQTETSFSSSSTVMWTSPSAVCLNPCSTAF